MAEYRQLLLPSNLGVEKCSAEEEAAHRKAVLAQQLCACGVSKLQQRQSAARLHHVARHRALAQALQRGHIAVATLLCAARPAHGVEADKATHLGDRD